MTKEIPVSERPLSEQYRVVARKWIDAENAAELLYELKTTSLEALKAKVMSEQGDLGMSDAAAQRMAMNMPEWREYLEKLCGHRADARKYKVQLEYFKLRHMEQQSLEATARAERKL